MKIIDICLLRLKKVKTVKNIILCTTKNTADNKFLKILENPYDNNLKISNYYKTDIKSGEPYKTFCGT